MYHNQDDTRDGKIDVTLPPSGKKRVPDGGCIRNVLSLFSKISTRNNCRRQFVIF